MLQKAFFYEKVVLGMNIIQVFYVMIPAFLANMAPPVLAKYSPLNAPMDFGFSLGGIRIFGDQKTWAGFVIGIIVAVLAGFILSKVYWPFDFSAITWSALVGAGTLLGDAVKSFFKRRVGIKSGKPWIPFDQVDYTIGALALGSFVFFPGWLNAFLVVFISAFGHIATNHIGY